MYARHERAWDALASRPAWLGAPSAATGEREGRGIVPGAVQG